MYAAHIETIEHLCISMFEVQSCVRGYQVYQNVWTWSVKVLSYERGS